MARVLSIEPYRGIHHRVTFTDIDVENNDIRFRNFSGKADDRGYNKEGDRNFKLVIAEEDVDKLIDIGMHVTRRESSRPGSEPTYQTKIGISYKFDEPAIILVSGDNEVALNERTVGRVDQAELIDCDHLVVTTANNRFNDTKLAYVEEMRLYKRPSLFRDKYNSVLGTNAAPSEGPYEEDESNLPF